MVKLLIGKRWKKVFVGAMVGVAMMGAGVVNAEQVWVQGVKVIRTLSEAGAYGDCMIMIDKPISGFITGCPNNGWVTLSCDGTYNSKDAGQRKFESAQLAMALGYKVTLFVDNTKKHNGYCFGQRIDIYK